VVRLHSDSRSSPKDNADSCSSGSRLIRDGLAEGEGGQPMKSSVHCSVIFAPTCVNDVFLISCVSLILTLPAIVRPSPARQGVRCCLHASFYLSAGLMERL